MLTKVCDRYYRNYSIHVSHSLKSIPKILSIFFHHFFSDTTNSLVLTAGLMCVKCIDFIRKLENFHERL
jgi:hypothetical protein